MKSSIYQAMIDAGVPISHHESDLYAEVNPASREIVRRYEHRHNVRMFTDKETGHVWYDIPFAYQPFWDNVSKSIISSIKQEA